METSVVKLPELRDRYQRLQNEVQYMERRKHELQRNCKLSKVEQ
jgi:hypothetical protein